MAGCGKLPSSFVTSDKIKVVCTTFPQYDWVRQILGENDDFRFDIEVRTVPGINLPVKIGSENLVGIEYSTQAM